MLASQFRLISSLHSAGPIEPGDPEKIGHGASNPGFCVPGPNMPKKNHTSLLRCMYSQIISATRRSNMRNEGGDSTMCDVYASTSFNAVRCASPPNIQGSASVGGCHLLSLTTIWVRGDAVYSEIVGTFSLGDAGALALSGCSVAIGNGKRIISDV